MSKTSNELAEAFLRWPLPESVCSDLCATKQQAGRIGTNLLSYTEAKQMIEEVVGPKIAGLEAEIYRLNTENAVMREHNKTFREMLKTWANNQNDSGEDNSIEDWINAVLLAAIDPDELRTALKKGILPWMNMTD